MTGCIYKYVCGFYIDIWQVWWNIYVCRFLKLANLSTLIFGRFFLKNKNKNWQVIEIVGKKLKKKIHPSCWNSWKEILKNKINKILAGCWKLTVGIVEFEKVGTIEFEKEMMLERNNKERLKNNILIKW